MPSDNTMFAPQTFMAVSAPTLPDLGASDPGAPSAHILFPVSPTHLNDGSSSFGVLESSVWFEKVLLFHALRAPKCILAQHLTVQEMFPITRRAFDV
jgi:hypothetical protein